MEFKSKPRDSKGCKANKAVGCLMPSTDKEEKNPLKKCLLNYSWFTMLC